MLANILTCAYNFTVKETPEAETLILSKIKNAIFLFLHHVPGFTFQGSSNSNNNVSFLLLFDGLWKVKAKYIVLCLNASAKFRNVKGTSYDPALMGNTGLLVICISGINTVSELLLVSSRWYAGQETLWSWGRCLLRRMRTWNLYR